MGEHSLLLSDGQIEVVVESVVLHPQFSSITSDYGSDYGGTGYGSSSGSDYRIYDFDVALLLLAAPGGDWALWDRVSHNVGKHMKTLSYGLSASL